MTPSGRIIDRDTEVPDVRITTEPTSEIDVVFDPEPGVWCMVLHGRQAISSLAAVGDLVDSGAPAPCD